MKSSTFSIGLIALSAAFAVPTAFAQEADAATQHDGTTQAIPPTEQVARAPHATTPMAAEQAAPIGAPDTKKVTWSDLDVDKDGNLSKSEAQPLSSLSAAFVEADSDADGNLTADEYKAYLAKSGNGASPPQG